VLNYQEEEARGAFQSGNALFMRNWPYAWSLAQAADSPVRGKVGAVELPSGGAEHASTLGGWSLAVSRCSRNPREALDLVRWLTSSAEQKRRLLEAGLNPTIADLYQDPEVVAANPLAPKLRRIFEKAVVRPARATNGKYQRVSAEIQNSVHRLLEERATRTDVDAELSRLARTLRRIGRNGKW
jgi:trehalose/maltose transport system substrate-binding protein